MLQCIYGLRSACKHAQVASCQPGQFAALLHRMVPKLRESLVEQLLKKETASV